MSEENTSNQQPADNHGTPSAAGGDPVAGGDAIAQAFARMRQQAQQRTGHLPDMATPVQRPRRTSRKKTTPRGLGKPTGPDGRALVYQKQPTGVGDILNREIEARGWRKPIAGGWVHGHWEELVGEKIAQHTKVEMLKETTLFITCDTTAWATNLRVMQRQILQAIAQKVGPGVVTELKIYGPKAPSWRKGPLHVPGRGPRDTYG